jgi:hypothetical protein
VGESSGGLFTSTSTEEKLYSLEILVREFNIANLLDEDRKNILAIVLVESAFDPNAISAYYAKGIGQIKDGTARDLLYAGGGEALEDYIPGNRYHPVFTNKNGVTKVYSLTSTTLNNQALAQQIAKNTNEIITNFLFEMQSEKFSDLNLQPEDLAIFSFDNSTDYTLCQLHHTRPKYRPKIPEK